MRDQELAGVSEKYRLKLLEAPKLDEHYVFLGYS